MLELDDSEVYWWHPLDNQREMDTRDKILFAAYKEIHVNGFQAASLNNILAHTGVTKGALYHHFPNKTELGYAVVDEVIAERIEHSFIAPLNESDDPVTALTHLIEQSGKAFSLRDIQLGCPLGNLTQEMAPIDEGFRLRLNRIYDAWYQAIEDAVTRSQQAGHIIRQVSSRHVAVMVVATMEGCLNAGMISQDLEKLLCCGEALIQYLTLIKQ
ncbi:MAG: TetR/AcrR family transcriptional regulator [Gammaproteobacteria bacterium]|nr:TetR/AcrR family transcriptional regulator [Gammaproteobacteria bacterium]